MLNARELHRRGIEAVNAGRVRRAGSLLQLARERAGDPELLARIDVSRAYVALELGDADRAERLCRSALAGTATAPVDRGVALSQLAMVHMRRGEPLRALELFTEGIDLLGDSVTDLAKARGNRGDVYLHQGRHGLAAADFRASAELFAEVGAEVDRAKAEHNLGYARFLQGDLVTAHAAMDSAARTLSGISPVLRAICEQDRAEVLMAAGLDEQGSALLAAAARGYGSRRLRQRQAEAELTLARSLQIRDPARARVLARQASRRFARLQAAPWQARADAVALGVALDRTRRAGTEVAAADALSGVLLDQGLRWSAAGLRIRTANLLVRTGALDEAAQRLRGIDVAGEAPLEIRVQHREARAALGSARGRPADALHHLRAGLAELHLWQSSFGSLDLQTGVAGQGVRLGVRGLALAVESRKPAVLLEWSERARMLASRVQPVRAPEDEELVADLAELRRHAHDEGSHGRAREAELRQRVRERAWQHRGSGEVADPVDLPDLQAALDAGTALVAYVVTADAAAALVVTSGGPTWADLGDRAALDALLGGLLPDLDVAAADLPGPMAAAVRGALADRLDRLAALLVAPVLDAVGDRRVVLTPSGVLAGVPWTLLPGYIGRPVTVAQSATSWLARRTTPLRVGSAGFVAGPRVVRAEDEVTAAAKEWRGARVLVGEAATAAAVSELAEQVDVLHVAAHGRHSAENPLFSGLLLADGSWFGYDVDRLRAVPDVVLLSACEVGRSTVRWGEELIGMSAAWLHAGARCVIASAAAVNDAAAYDVLVAVHQQLAAGVDPAAALAAAVPAVAGGPGGTAPVPLVCFG